MIEERVNKLVNKIDNGERLSELELISLLNMTTFGGCFSDGRITNNIVKLGERHYNIKSRTDIFAEDKINTELEQPVEVKRTKENKYSEWKPVQDNFYVN